MGKKRLLLITVTPETPGLSWGFFVPGGVGAGVMDLHAAPLESDSDGGAGGRCLFLTATHFRVLYKNRYPKMGGSEVNDSLGRKNF